MDPGEPEPRSQAPVFADELRAAIARSGLSLSEIHRRLVARRVRVSLAALSQWRSGTRVPQSAASLAVVGSLEEILDLRPNALWDLLTVPLDGGRAVGRSKAERLVGVPPSLLDAVAELELLDRQLDDVAVHVTLDVGPDRCVRSIHTTQIVRARRADAQRLAMFLVLDGEAREFPRFTAISGCAPGRRAERLEEGLAVVELILSSPLPRNSTAVYEVRSELAPYLVGESDFYAHAVSGRVVQVIVEARFDQDHLPHAGEAFIVDANGSETSHTPRAVHGDLHNIAHDFGPGQVGIRWWWT